MTPRFTRLPIQPMSVSHDKARHRRHAHPSNRHANQDSRRSPAGVHTALLNPNLCQLPLTYVEI
jgi:hypothetical protein